MSDVRRWGLNSLVLVALLICPQWAAPASATTWYVNDSATPGDMFCSRAGNDAYSGSNSDSPFLTIGRAVAGAVPGDTIVIDVGTYPEAVSLDTSSLSLVGADSITTIIDAPGDSTVLGLYSFSASNCTGLILRELAFVGANRGIYFNNVDYSAITSCSIAFNGALGVYLTGGSSNNLLSRNTSMYNNGSGFLIESSSNANLLEHNLSYDHRGPGYKFDLGSNGNLLRNSECWNCESDGVMIVGSHNNVVDHVISRDHLVPDNLSGFWLYNATNNTLLNNTATNNGVAGYLLQDSSDNLLAANASDSNIQYEFSLVNALTNTCRKNNINTPGQAAGRGYATGSGSAHDATLNYWSTTNESTISPLLNGTGISWLPYRLGAVDTGAEADTLAPGTPGNVSADTFTANQVLLTWDTVTVNEDGAGISDLLEYRVYRCTSGQLPQADWKANGYLGNADRACYYDTTVSGGSAYYYRVTAVDNHSPWENESWFSDTLPATASSQSVVWGDIWYVNDASAAGDLLTTRTGNNGYTGNHPDSPFQTITYALSVADSGDTIYIDVGTYAEAVTIDTDTLFLIGADSVTTVIDPPGDSSTGGLYALSATNRIGLYVRELALVGANHGLHFSNVDYSTVTSCSIAFNGALGVYLTAGSSNNTLAKNTSVKNNGSGFLIESSSNYNLLEENVSFNHAAPGYKFDVSSNYNTLRNSECWNCGSDGVMLVASHYNRVENIFSHDHRIPAGLGGFWLSDATNNLLLNNRSRGNGAAGYSLYDSTDNILSGNSSDSNDQYELMFYGASAADTCSKNNIYAPGLTPDSGAYSSIAGAPFSLPLNYWYTTNETVIDTLMGGTASGLLSWLPYRLGAVDTAVGADTQAPTSPSGISADTSIVNLITLSWSPVTTSEDSSALGDLAGYRVYRCTDTVAPLSDWKVSGYLAAAGSNSYFDTDLVPGATYLYRITAYDNHSPWENESWFSDTFAVAATFPDTLPPLSPVVTILEGETTTTAAITLQFNLGEDTAGMQYQVSEFSDYAGSSWAAWQDTQAFTVSAGSETKTIYFAVRDPAGNWAQDTVQIFVVSGLVPASGLVGLPLAGGGVRLSWVATPSVTAETYLIYWDSGTGTVNYAAPWAAVDTGTLAYESGGLVVGETYVFHLIVTNTSGDTDHNTTVKATVNVAPDTGHLYALIRIPKTGQRIAGNAHLIKADVYGDTALGAAVTFEYRLAGAIDWTPVPAVGSQHPNPDWSDPWFIHWDADLMAEGAYELRAVAWNVSETDPAPAIIQVTVDRQNPDVRDYTDSSGNQQKKERVAQSGAIAATIGDTAGEYSVAIPAGSITTSTMLNLLVFTDSLTAFSGVGRTQYDTGGTMLQLSLDNGQTTFGDTITIRIPYQDNDGDSIIDGSFIRLSLVQLLYYDEESGLWQAIARENTAVDAEAKMLVAAVTHFSKFAAGKQFHAGDLGTTGSSGIPDGDVDLDDLAKFNASFNRPAGSGQYLERADVAGGSSEGIVDEDDLFEFAASYGSAP